MKEKTARLIALFCCMALCICIVPLQNAEAAVARVEYSATKKGEFDYTVEEFVEYVNSLMDGENTSFWIAEVPEEFQTDTLKYIVMDRDMVLAVFYTTVSDTTGHISSIFLRAASTDEETGISAIGAGAYLLWLIDDTFDGDELMRCATSGDIYNTGGIEFHCTFDEDGYALIGITPEGSLDDLGNSLNIDGTDKPIVRDETNYIVSTDEYIVALSEVLSGKYSGYSPSMTGYSLEKTDEATLFRLLKNNQQTSIYVSTLTKEGSTSRNIDSVLVFSLPQDLSEEYLNTLYDCCGAVTFLVEDCPGTEARLISESLISSAKIDGEMELKAKGAFEYGASISDVGAMGTLLMISYSAREKSFMD